MAEQRREPNVGMILDGRFRIGERIGEGGMGLVHAGTQLSVDRPVAIKIIREHLSDERTVALRFLREARLLTALNHPNIVQVFELGQTEAGALYLVMEMLRGRTLDLELAQTGPFDVRRACEVAIQLCAALAAAHAHGIVHRDLKPANIMLLDDPAVRDLVKVLDFGLAKSFEAQAASPASELTIEGAIMGTPLYMAPEQLSGGAPDPRTDLYALGCIMYEMLGGSAPFVDPAVNVILARHLEDRPAPLPARVPLPLQRIVYALLAKAPEHRPASAAGVRAELERLLEAESAEDDLDDVETLVQGHAALRPTAPRRQQRPPRRGSLWLFGVAAVVLAVSSFLIALAILYA